MDYSDEISELIAIKKDLSKRFPQLNTELEKLEKSQDNQEVCLLYCRRSLDIVLDELTGIKFAKKRHKKESNKGTIDKLNHDGIIPGYVFSAMHNVNNIGNYGAHLGEFDPRQIKSAIHSRVPTCTSNSATCAMMPSWSRCSALRNAT